MNIGRTLRTLGARYRARITKGTTAAEKNGAAINPARAQRTDDDVAGVMDQKQLGALVAKLTDTASTIATKQALDEGRRIGASLVEVNLRLRLVKRLHDQGVEIPKETDVVALLKTKQRELKDAEQATISEQLATVAASGLAAWMDEKSAHNRARRLERQRRRANGDCIDCPKKRLRRAAPGSTRCDKCGEKHRAQGVKYRQRKKTQEGGTACGTKGAVKKNVGRRGTATAEHRSKDGERRNPQSGIARSAIEGPGSTQQVERERCGVGGEFTNSRELERDADGGANRRPILGDTFGEGADADEVLGNVSRGPRIRLVLNDALRELCAADNGGNDVDGIRDLREVLHSVLGEADNGLETEPRPSDADDEPPHSPG